jgi:tetratricopeptide (TPR) repeat protein
MSMEFNKYIIDRKIQRLQQDIAQKPSDHALLSELAYAFNIRGMYKEALTAAEKSLEIEPHNPQGWYELITSTAFAKEEELTKLLQQCQQIAENNAQESWPYNNLAFLYYYLEQFDKIEPACNEAIRINPSDESAYRIMGYYYFALHNYPEAKKYFQLSIEKKNLNCRSLMPLGHCYLENNDLDGARSCYEKCIEQEEYFIFGWNALGRLYLNQEEGEHKALQCFHKALSINPRFWQPYFTLADYYFGNKRYDEAISQYLHILTLSPETRVKVECHTTLGFLFTYLNETSKAFYHLNQAIKADEHSAAAFHYLGSLYLKGKKYKKAMESFQRAITMNPSYTWAYTKMGTAYLEQNNLKKAQEYFDKALKLDKEEYWAHLGLADIYRKQRKADKQLKECLDALSIAPDDSDVRNYLGIAYECNKKYDEAIAQYNKALELDSYNRGAANNLGFLYEKLWQKQPSQQLKQKAVEAWMRRLLICRDTSHSIKGAVKHLKELGVKNSVIEDWLESGQLDSIE